MLISPAPAIAREFQGQIRVRMSCSAAPGKTGEESAAAVPPVDRHSRTASGFDFTSGEQREQRSFASGSWVAVEDSRRPGTAKGESHVPEVIA